MKALEKLLSLADPPLRTAMAETGVELEAFCAGWFLSMFSNTLQTEVLQNVWDIILSEKDGEGETDGARASVLLFRGALLLFELGSEKLIASS